MGCWAGSVERWMGFIKEVENGKKKVWVRTEGGRVV